MPVFKLYFRILKTQLGSVLITLSVFLFIAVNIASSQFKENNEKTFQRDKVRVLLVNEDGETKFIKGFLDYLEQYVTYVTVEDKEEARKDALFFDKAEYILTIPKGFTKAFLAGKETAITKEGVEDIAEGISLETAINNYLNQVKIYLQYVPDLRQEDISTYVSRSLKKETAVTFDVKQNKEKMGSDEYNSYYFNFLAYSVLSSFITAISAIMLAFHRVDIQRRQNVSPVTNLSAQLQLILGNLVFVICYMLVCILGGYFTNPYRSIDGHTLLMWLNVMVFAFTALAISYLIGLIVKSKNAVAALSTGISLGMAFISGMFVPQQFLGKTVLKVASFTPAYWYVKANNSIGSLTGYQWKDLSGIISYMAIQAGFAAAFFSITMVIAKNKRQQEN